MKIMFNYNQIVYFLTTDFQGNNIYLEGKFKGNEGNKLIVEHKNGIEYKIDSTKVFYNQHHVKCLIAPIGHEFFFHNKKEAKYYSLIKSDFSYEIRDFNSPGLRSSRNVYINLEDLKGNTIQVKLTQVHLSEQELLSQWKIESRKIIKDKKGKVKGSVIKSYCEQNVDNQRHIVKSDTFRNEACSFTSILN